MQIKQDKIKELLLFFEESPNVFEDFRNNRTEEDQVQLFHLLILEDAGFIEIGNGSKASDGVYLILNDMRITYQGNEYLQAVKEKKVWEKIKDYSIGTAKEVGKQLLIAAAKDQVGLDK